MSRCVKCGNIDGIRTPFTICKDCSKSGKPESVNWDLKDPKGKLMTAFLSGHLFLWRTIGIQGVVYNIQYEDRERIKYSFENSDIDKVIKQMSEYLDLKQDLSGRWLWKAYGTFVTVVSFDDKIVEFKDDQNNQWKYFKADFLERFVKQ